MNLSNFFQTCLYFCLCMIIVTLCINFVDGLGVFPTPIESGVDVSGSSDDIFTKLTNIKGGLKYVWAFAIGTGLAVAGLVAWVTHSTIPFGIYLFSAVFWTSYGRALSIVYTWHIPGDFLVIGTVLMLFLFAGAVAGMLSGSG